jgi:GDP-4-dehydro-6-deoxy-D-mannose reductase
VRGGSGACLGTPRHRRRRLAGPWLDASICSIARRARGARAARPSVIYHCAGLADLQDAWRDRRARCASTCSARTTCSRPRATPACRAASSSPVGADLPPQRGRVDEDDSDRPGQPVRRQQAGAGDDARRRRACPWLARPFNHAGPRQSPAYATSAFAQQIAEIEAAGANPSCASATSTRCATSPTCATRSRAYQAIAERGRPRPPYNVCSGRAYSMRQLLDILLSLARVRVRVEVDPARLRPSDNPVILGSHARLTADTGWTPVIPIEQTLADLLGSLAPRSSARHDARPSRREATPRTRGSSSTCRWAAFALLLRWLPWWQAVALAARALAFNLFCCRAAAVNLYRPAIASAACTASSGIRSRSCCCSSSSRRPDIVAAAWGILAIGDGIATLAGRRDRRPRWPWNREKTVSGSAAFAIGGAAAGVFLAWWCRPASSSRPHGLHDRSRPIAAAIAAALVETIRCGSTTTCRSPCTAAAVMWLASLRLDRAAAAGHALAAGACRRRSRSTPASRGPAIARARSRAPGAVAGALIGSRSSRGSAGRAGRCCSSRSSPRRSRRGSG